MNNDLISRYALRKSVTDELERLHCVLYKYNEYYQATNKAFNTVLDFIDRAPTVDPEVEGFTKDDMAGAYNEGYMCGSREAENARPKGEWRVYEGAITCEECGKEADEITPFCAWCGADMRKR